MPSIQIQLPSAIDSDIKEHMNRFGYYSKNDFLIEVIITEWLADNKQKIEEFRKRFKDKEE